MTETCRSLILPGNVRTRRIALFGLVLAFISCLAPMTPLSAAVTCDDRFGCGRNNCATPAHPVPQSLWGDLQPVDPDPLPSNRDATAFDEFRQSYASKNWYYSVDVENNIVFMGTAYGLQAWDARTNPASPTLLGTFSYGAIPQGINSAEEKWPLRAADAPPGVDNTVALVGVAGLGISIVDFTVKTQPKILYQNYKKNSESVYTANINGRMYAFMGAKDGESGGGLYVFDMTAARAAGANGVCLEAVPAPGENQACSGVYKGKFRSKVSSAKADIFQVDGVDNYIVVSFGTQRGWEIWDVSDPANPTLKTSGQSERSVYGVSLWKDGSRYYLATRTEHFSAGVQHLLNTYDVSCISGTCSGTPSTLSAVERNSGTSNAYLSFSRSNGTPFLYLGSDNRCTGEAQREWLLDVSSPSSPRDITPSGTTTAQALYSGVIQNVSYGYWGWYYRGNPNGLNLLMPRAGKFNGDYFYRAGLSIFDIHKRTTASPPQSDFTYSPLEVYPGSPVTFTDRSTGAPNQWAWTFQDGTPGSSSSQNPTVGFSTPGAKTVTLRATNNVGAGSLSTKTITVLPAAPQIGALVALPANPIVCQTVALSATGVTGQPPIAYSWVIKSDATTLPVTSGSGTTISWSTVGILPGSYTATLTVTNGTSSTTASKTFSVGALLPLAFSGAGGAPTNDAFTNGTVKFHSVTVGATEWSWDFGDGAGFQPFTGDPVNGPDPTFTYSTTGTKNVRVKIRNCVQAEITSATLPVVITQTTPLIAGFQANNVFCSHFGCVATVGVAITFANTSSGASLYDYDWNGDGDFTDPSDQLGLAAPVTSHTYSSEGTYSPVLRVRRGASEQATFTHNAIIVAGANPNPNPNPTTPSISISGSSSGTTGSSYTFSASGSNCSPGNSGWNWTVNGGTIAGSSTGSSISVSWATAGSKSLTATHGACSGAAGTKSVSISEPNPGPGSGTLQSAFSYSPTAPKVGEAISFNGTASTGTPTGYTWHFGDGTPDVTGSTTSHAFTVAGTYPVRLAVTRPGTGSGCLLGTCVSELTQNVVVVDGAPPISADYSASATCVNQFGIDQCTGTTGTVYTLTASSTDATSYSWNFGDGTPAGTGRVVSHTWTVPNPYAVILTVTKTGQSATKTKVFNISGTPKPKEKSVVLPWIAQTRGALVQSSDLWVFNPAATAIQVKCELRKRGLPDSNPPAVTRTIQPGAVLYSSDALRDLFGRENLAGFILCQGVDTEVEPVVTSFNTTFQPDGKQFGQSIPGLSKEAAAAATAGPTIQHLVGLNDNADRLAYFGLSNPSSENAVVKLRIYDRAGVKLGETAGDITLSQFGQKQYQVSDIRSLFGVNVDDDYRVEIETKSGGPVFPYAANLRLASGDPSFIESRRTDNSKGYLVGIFSAPGLGGSKWQSDVVLSNPGTQVATTDIIFQGSGLQTLPTNSVRITLQPGESQRLANVLLEKWGLSEAVGTLIFQSVSAGGVFPVCQAEVYDNAVPTKRFGQAMTAQADTDAATVGKSQFLVGLRQEANYRSTITLYNPTTGNATFDLIYRNRDGVVLGTLSNRVLGSGKVQQINSAQHPLGASGIAGGFTVEVKVKEGGGVLTTAQIVNNQTNDPSFIAGRTR